MWWEIARCNPKMMKVCKVVIKLLTGEGNLEVNTGRHTNRRIPYQERLCRMCGEEVETAKHMVLKCNNLNEKRAPIQEVIAKYDFLFNELSEDQKLSFLFGKEELIQTEDLVTIGKALHEMYVSRPTIEQT